MQEFEKLYESRREAVLQDLFRFLEFRSISTDAEFRDQVLSCSKWVSDYLQNGGFEVEKWDTPGYPVVFAQNLEAGPDKPTVLFYGHYDVQPVDPLELWTSPPFEPTIRDGEIFARGAQDNKGQILYTMAALVAAKESGNLPINVKIIVEGEEEIGSAGLVSILGNYRDKLRADHVVVVDVGFKNPDSPAVVIGVRGMVAMDLVLRASNTDLHSGTHGGIAYNPNRALSEILASLWDEQGVIQIPGFYDDVEQLTDIARQELASDLDLDWYRKMFGTEPNGGEQAYTPFERAWIRPTIEINGMVGGYHGTGFKTVIPREASAKISCRLVPNQNPADIGEKVAAYLRSKAPQGMQADVIVQHSGLPIRSGSGTKVVQAAKSAISQVTGIECEITLEGGSIPAISELARAAEGEVALIGYGYPDDNMHAPNEHFGVERMKQGFLTVLCLLKNLAN